MSTNSLTTTVLYKSDIQNIKFEIMEPFVVLEMKSRSADILFLYFVLSSHEICHSDILGSGGGIYTTPSVCKKFQAASCLVKLVKKHRLRLVPFRRNDKWTLSYAMGKVLFI